MGLFSSIKDSFFLTKCVEQVKHVSPHSTHYAEEFCTTTKHFLLAMRDKGANHADAVNMVCLMILDKPDSFRESEDRNKSRSNALVVASYYCLTFAERWPNDSYSLAMMKAATAFASYAKTHSLRFA